MASTARSYPHSSNSSSSGSTTHSRHPTATSNHPPPPPIPPPISSPPPPDIHRSQSSTSSRSFATAFDAHSNSNSNSSYHTTSATTPLARPHPQLPPPTSNSSAEAAFGYDDLLGPRPVPLGERELSPSRPTYEEGGGERVARAMMQGLGLSTGESRSVSPVGGGREAKGEGEEQQETEERKRRSEREWSSPQSSQQQPFPSHSQPPQQPSSSYFSSQLGNHPSTSSLASVSTTTTSIGGGGMMSPLSPLVEPFSPATSASGGSSSAAWGVREREPSNLDLRTFQQQSSPLPHPSFSRQAEHTLHHSSSQFSTPSPSTLHHHQQQPHPYLSHDRAAALAALQGQRGSQQQQQQQQTDQSTTFYHPQPSYLLQQQNQHPSSNPTADDLPSPSGLISPPPPPTLSSSTMSQSLSRDSQTFSPTLNSTTNPVAAAALFGLVGSRGLNRSREREREIPTDRGGYVRAGYAEASARGALNVGTGVGGGGGVGVGLGTGTGTSTPSALVSGQAGGGGGGEQSGQDEISTIFVVGFPEDMLEREFQNMFIFATGFQAATLKIPASTVVARERERELATAAAISSAVGGVGPNAGGIVGIAGAGIASASPYQSEPYGGPLGPSTSTSGLDQLASPPSSTGGGIAYEDAFGHTPLASTDSSTTLASVLGPLVARDAAGSPAGTRKQIIGFARFNTRAQALDARDMLSGKKVDAEKGNVLKAEMAKKNLHTKRGLSNELGGGGLAAAGGGPSFPLAALDQQTLARLANAGNLSPAVLAELARQTAASQISSSPSSTANPPPSSVNPVPPLPSPHQQQEAARHSAAFEAFHSVPTPTPPTQQQQLSSYASTQQQPFPTRESSLPGGGGGGSASRGRSGGAEYFDDSISSTYPSNTTSGSGSGSGSTATTTPAAGGLAWPTTSSNPASSRAYSHERSMSSSPEYQQQQQQPHHHHHQHSATPNDPPPQSPTSTSSSSSPIMRGNHQQYLQPGQQQGVMQQFESGTYSEGVYDDSPIHLPPLGLGATAAGGGGGGASYQYSSSAQRGFGLGFAVGPTSPSGGGGAGFEGVGVGVGVGATTGASSGIPRSQNPADMNAPKNTLYVGGLPAVLPSLTGPFSAAHLEDSLRNAFSRCPGFRRLSFRSKSNGPIVFVEFEDVMYATRALTEMYGNTLGGIVKGGIRLSYSKNPLGVRSGSASHHAGASAGGSHSSPSLGGAGAFGAESSMYAGGGGSSMMSTFGHGPGPITSPQPLLRPSESVFGGDSSFRLARSPPLPSNLHQQQHQSSLHQHQQHSNFNSSNSNFPSSSTSSNVPPPPPPPPASSFGGFAPFGAYPSES